MNEPSGIKRAINATWEKIPEILIAGISALLVFGFTNWLLLRDSIVRIDHVESEQSLNRICERIGACPVTIENANEHKILNLANLPTRLDCEKVNDKIGDLRERVGRIEATIHYHGSMQ